jgi:hypothetical protein
MTGKAATKNLGAGLAVMECKQARVPEEEFWSTTAKEPQSIFNNKGRDAEQRRLMSQKFFGLDQGAWIDQETINCVNRQTCARSMTTRPARMQELVTTLKSAIILSQIVKDKVDKIREKQEESAEIKNVLQ